LATVAFVVLFAIAGAALAWSGMARQKTLIAMIGS
jgi:hypothetical protein